MNEVIEKYMATVIDTYRARIEARLRAATRGIGPATLRAPMAHVVDAGGKRLRPLITMLACGAAGGTPLSALDASVAVELLHTFTLVHDDIMDNAGLRRGLATVHTKWDANTAILSGDTIAAVALESLARRGHPRTPAITQRFARAFVQVCEGQALDKELEIARTVTMPAYLEMIGLKTAAMFAMSAAVGGVIGSPSVERARALERFGWELGMAFQIRDDALDVGADLKKFGKDAGGDIREGKKTFLFVAGIDAAKTPADRALINKYISHQGLRGADVARLRDFYHRAGVMARAERAIDLHTKRALAALHTLPASVAQTRLEAMARALTGRTY